MIVRPKVEQYAEEHTSPPSALLAKVAAATASATDRPEMMIGAIEGGLLAMLVAMQRPRRILEIGTFTGYSALSMAEAMPAGCRIVTLEADAFHASLARRHIAASPWEDRIEVREGPALDTLSELAGPFDLVFIDADKPSYIRFLDAVLPCSVSEASSPSITRCTSPLPPTPRTLWPSRPSTLTWRAAPTSFRCC